MQNLLDNLTLLFTFLFNQLSSFAGFFTSNVLGMIILGISIFSLTFYMIGFLISKFK